MLYAVWLLRYNYINITIAYSLSVAKHILYKILLYYYTFFHNQTEYFGFVFPTMKSAACDTPGISKIFDKIGTCLKNISTVGKKLPNKFKNPKASTITPMSPHLIMTSTNPVKKSTLPRTFFVNNMIDRSMPMVRHNPIKNNKFPIAIKAESKKSNIPVIYICQIKFHKST